MNTGATDTSSESQGTVPGTHKGGSHWVSTCSQTQHQGQSAAGAGKPAGADK